MQRETLLTLHRWVPLTLGLKTHGLHNIPLARVTGHDQWRGPPSSFETGTGMGNTHIYGTQWVQVWVIPVLSKSHGWRRGCSRNSVGGCWVGAARVLRGGVQRVNCNSTKRQYTGSHTNPLGAHRNFPWVQRGCNVGVLWV